MAMRATRTNPNEYTVTNKDGTSLKVSPHGTPGAFSPGELLQAALLGCASLSADMQLAHMLGKDFHAEAEVKSTEEDNHISEMLFDFLIDTEGRDEQEREKIIQAAAKKIEQLCIVKRSLNKGISTHTDISAK
ncbi:OsmC family protein [Corynebacterium stationis]|uniref:OsmC family protein n=1 Tax=Corynebacterium stationis TaxID=1705 RepID=UPI00175B6FFA|nr:OsmC family protein [Corynebacterium stationis]HHT58318.1 osmotically inducible protein C [Corynebacterium stationis]